MKFNAESGAMDSKNYLRLKDKESAVGLFVGEPYDFRGHWTGKQLDLCSEDNLCSHCATGLKSTFRFRSNIIVKEGESYVARIFEQAWTVYETMKKLNSEYDLEKHLVRISRSGTGLSDTAYSIIPVKDGEVKPELAKKLAVIPLHDLKHKDDPKRTEQKSDSSFHPEPAFDSTEELPF